MPDARATHPGHFQVLAATGALAVLLILGGYWQYHLDVQAIRAARYDELAAIADLKQRQLVAWRSERLTDARLDTTGALHLYLQSGVPAPDAAAAWAAISERLRTLASLEGYADVLLAAPDGRLLRSVTPGQAALEPEPRRLVAQSLASRQAVVGHFFACAACGGVRIDVAAPIFGTDGQPVAVLLLRSDPERQLYPLILSLPTPSRSAETLLVRKDAHGVVFLNRLRHRADPPLTIRIGAERAEVPAIAAAYGNPGRFEGLDYRGVAVLADVRRIAGSPWAMVAKVDAAEVLGAARERGRVIAVVVLLALLATAATAAFVRNRLQRNAYRQALATERQRRAVQEEIRATLYGIGDGVITTDPQGRVARLNPAAEHLTGWTEAQAAGQPVQQVFHIVNEATRAEVESPVVHVLRDGVIVGLANHTLLIARDGTERPIADSGAPIRDVEGGIQGVVLVFRDQTDERAAEHALRDSKALLERSQRVAAVGHYVFDVVAGIWTSSAVLDEIFGIDAEAAHAVATWLDLVHPDERAEMAAYLQDHVITGGHVFDRAYRIVRKRDQAVRWLHGLGDLERDAAGRPVRMFGTIQDVTSRVILEDQLRQAQKMESVGRLAGGVAHDFNNMLGIIIGSAEMALDQVDADAALRLDLEQILDAAQRSANLTRQLLAFARRQTANPRVLDLNATVGGMLSMLHRLIGEDIRLQWRPGAGVWPVRVDPAQIDQILANLAVNARDAISGTGELAVATENAALDASYCAQHPGMTPGDYVQLTVSDTGKGMDKAILDHLFEPFFTTKEPGKGTGLGLATVYGIVRQNNGFIHVYSEPGRGTTFRVYLPRVDDAAAVADLAPEPALVGGTETVLVVEDEQTILTLAQRLLTLRGYAVLTAGSPSAALALVASYDGAIDLLLTDVVMPEMNGLELYRKLQSLRPGLQVLYMSGYTADVIAHHGVLQVGIRFLQKPFTARSMAEKVREVLGDGCDRPQ